MHSSEKMKLRGMKWPRTIWLNKKGLIAYNKVRERFSGGNVKYFAATSTYGNWAWQLLDKIASKLNLKAGDDIEKALDL